MKKHSFSTNYLFNLAYNMAVGLAPLVTTPYLSRVLGPEEIGKFSFAQSIVTYFALIAALGTSQYGQRKIASLKDNEPIQQRAFWEIVNVRFILTSVTLLVYCVIILPFCRFPALYLAVALDIVYVGLDISWYFWGRNDFQIVSFSGCLCKLTYIVFVFLLVKNEQDVAIYAMLFSGTNVSACVVQWCSLRHTSLLNARHRNCNLKRHLKPAISLFSVQAATTIYTVLDKTMIRLITGSDAQTGYYAQAQKLVQMAVILVTAVSPVIATSIAEFWKKSDKKSIQETMEQSFNLVLGLSVPCCLGLILIAKRFVPLYYGDAFLSVIPLLSVFAFLIPAAGCTSTLGVQYFIPSKQEHHYRHAVIFSSIANITLNSALIPYLGATGAALASVLAEWSGALWMLLVIRKQISLVPVIKGFIRYSTISIVMLLSGFVLDIFLGEKFTSIIILVIVCVVVYLGGLVLLRDPLLGLFSILKKAKNV